LAGVVSTQVIAMLQESATVLDSGRPRLPAPKRRAINLARIDLVSLRLAMLCVETGSLSAAARRAHLSLSGASHRLSSLEDAFGTRLFERHPRGLRATRAGELVACQGGSLLEALDQLAERLAAAT
jgi:molybdenum-dependent DNA-binding transcriptional regulator ModE